MGELAGWDDLLDIGSPRANKGSSRPNAPKTVAFTVLDLALGADGKWRRLSAAFSSTEAVATGP